MENNIFYKNKNEVNFQRVFAIKIKPFVWRCALMAAVMSLCIGFNNELSKS